MAPSMIVTRALEAGLDLIAICDHNSAENAASVARAAEGTGLAVVPGMEIASREEVHVVGLFRDDDDARAVQEILYEHLDGENDPETFGEQLVMNDKDEVLGRNSRLLIGATDLSLEAVVRAIHDAGGTAIAAHVDRPSFSVISQLGFIPPDVAFDAAEVCGENLSAVPEELPVIRSSDAHRLEEIGARRTDLRVEQGTLAEIQMALKAAEGRKIVTAG